MAIKFNSENATMTQYLMKSLQESNWVCDNYRVWFNCP